MADIGEIRGRLVLSTNQWDASMTKAKGQMSDLGKSSQQTARDLELIQNAAIGLGIAVAGSVGAAVKTAADFEAQMKSISAVTGITGERLEELGDLAKEAGRSTVFSSLESAAAIEELAKAGLSVEQIINGGLKGALDLAAAGNISVAQAAIAASTALNAYKDENLEMSEAANILAGAANSSATDIGELQIALSQVSAVASGVGLNFRDTNAALALFSNNGLRGSDSGTSLKTMLSNLQPVTKQQIQLFEDLGLVTADGANKFFDAEGRLKSLDEVAGILSESLAGMTDQQRMLALETAFGSDAIRAANILFKEGAEGVKAMYGEMEKVSAAEVAATRMDTLRGAVEEFRGSLELVGIEVGTSFLPILTDIVTEITKVVRSLDETDMANIKAALAFGATASAIGIVATAIGKLSIAMRAFAMTPIGLAVTGLSILGGVIAGAVVQSNAMNEVTLDSVNAMIEQRDALSMNIEAYESLSARSKLSSDELARFVDINSLLNQTADPAVIAALKDEQSRLYESSGLTNEELDKLVQLNKDIIDIVPESSVKITEQGNALLNNADAAKKYNAEQLESIRLELENKRILAEANYTDNLTEQKRLKESINDLTTKINGNSLLIAEKEALILEATNEINRAKAAGHEEDAGYWKDQLFNAQQDLEILKETNGKLATKRSTQQESLELVQKELGKLDEVKRKMIDLELKQVNINAKRGEELTTLDSGIRKLEEQKRELQNTTPVAMRNKQEYKDSVTEIDRQISSLQGVKNRIIEITGQAQTMNYELGRDIRKNISTYQTEYLTQVRRAPLPTGPQDQRHGGGLVGSNQLIQRLSQLPNHNEVDTRLLRNEMVLTEAQQANLMRMIDAGFTGNQQQSSSPSSVVVNQTNTITVEGNIDSDIYDDIMRRQTQEYEMKLGMAGVKQR